MLKKLQKSKSEGFTIIEVMIVLAIAGMIILIVLLAVPALQRNGRNTAMKNDASALAAAVSEFKSNNDGRIPTTVTPNGSTVSFTGTFVGATSADGKVQGSTTVLSAGNPTQAGQLVVRLQNKCQSPTSLGLTGDTRSVAILYLVEQSGNTPTAPRCLDA